MQDLQSVPYGFEWFAFFDWVDPTDAAVHIETIKI
jgi:hypothetical protein